MLGRQCRRLRGASLKVSLIRTKKYKGTGLLGRAALRGSMAEERPAHRRTGGVGSRGSPLAVQSDSHGHLTLTSGCEVIQIERFTKVNGGGNDRSFTVLRINVNKIK